MKMINCILSVVVGVESLANYLIILHCAYIICKTIVDICVKYYKKNEYYQYHCLILLLIIVYIFKLTL